MHLQEGGEPLGDGAVQGPDVPHPLFRWRLARLLGTGESPRSPLVRVGDKILNRFIIEIIMKILIIHTYIHMYAQMYTHIHRYYTLFSNYILNNFYYTLYTSILYSSIQFELRGVIATGAVHAYVCGFPVPSGGGG